MAETTLDLTLKCDECGELLLRLDSGFVCPEGHGRILPLGEAQDVYDVPINLDGGGRIQQRGTVTACKQIERAMRALRRIEAEQQREEPSDGQ